MMWHSGTGCPRRHSSARTSLTLPAPPTPTINGIKHLPVRYTPSRPGA